MIGSCISDRITHNQYVMLHFVPYVIIKYDKQGFVISQLVKHDQKGIS